MTEYKNGKRVAIAMSDSTGATARNMLMAALDQFSGVVIEDHHVAFVRSPERVHDVILRAKEAGAIVVYTFVQPQLRDAARTMAHDNGVMAVDLMSELLGVVSTWLGMEPSYRPGHPHGPQYAERIAAIDFAEAHDDGKNAPGLLNADVIVLGLSGVSKSPVCRILATHRLRAANVPIVRGVDLPAELTQVDPRRVYVIVKSVPALIDTRKRSRVPRLGIDSDDPYIDIDSVREEARYALSLLRDNPGWTRVDMLSRTVEDTAAVILGSSLDRFPRG